MNPFEAAFGKRRPATSSPFGRVQFDDNQIVYLHGEVVDQLAWKNLSEIEASPLGGNAVADEVQFTLRSAPPFKSFSIPQHAEGASDLIDRLRSLPGFDSQAAAAGTKARIVCWRRNGKSRQ